MLDCQSSSLNAVFGREVRIQMLKMAVLDRQEGVEKRTHIESSADGRWGEGPDGKGGIKVSPICYICDHGGKKLSESLTVHSVEKNLV